MTQSQIRDLFRTTYNNSRNFMTPDVLGYGKRGRLVYELSTGHFADDTIYGVTVLEVDGTKRHDLSAGGFPSLDAAKTYIKEALQ